MRGVTFTTRSYKRCSPQEAISNVHLNKFSSHLYSHKRFKKLMMKGGSVQLLRSPKEVHHTIVRSLGNISLFNTGMYEVRTTIHKRSAVHHSSPVNLQVRLSIAISFITRMLRRFRQQVTFTRVQSVVQPITSSHFIFSKTNFSKTMKTY